MNYQAWVIDLKTKKYRKVGVATMGPEQAHREVAARVLGGSEVAVVLPARDLADRYSEVQQTLSDEVIDLVVVLYGPDNTENGV